MEEKTIPEATVKVDIPASSEVYVPSSTEKKRAVTMYLLVGVIMVAFNNQKKSNFESFHLKQALWWWAIFMFLIVLTVVFMLLPIIKYLPAIMVVVMVTIWWICVKGAWDGKYGIQEQNKLALFHALWWWIMMLFEVKEEEKKEWIMNNE